MPLLPRNSETFCHICAARRVNGDYTDAVQDAVAAWLVEYRASLDFGNDLPDLVLAQGLLALIARTAKAHRLAETEPPF